jgi:hypothetical protein
MTDRQFVQSLYPTAKIVKRAGKYFLGFHGLFGFELIGSSKSNTSNQVWKVIAKNIRIKMLHKLESV